MTDTEYYTEIIEELRGDVRALCDKVSEQKERIAELEEALKILAMRIQALHQNN